MPYRVRYSPDFDLKIRSGQVCQGDPRARSNSKNETIAYFSKLLSLIDTQIGFFRLYNIFEPSKIRQIWILHHTIHLKSCLSQTDYHTISYSYCFATWSKHHQNVGLSGGFWVRPAQSKVVKIFFFYFSYWASSTPWGHVLSLKTFCRNPALSWAIRYSVFQIVKFTSSFEFVCGNPFSTFWHLMVKFGYI